MGIPTEEELTAGGPPIRVCGHCKTEDDKHNGGEPTDISSPQRGGGLWLKCFRCGRRQRFIYLVDRKETDRKKS